ncbi:MAG: CBS domain-containing protein [Candidatus Poseidoniales archaeon]
MSEVRIRDLVLTDEHDTVELSDSLVDAAKKLLGLPRGILVALDSGKVKGVLTSIQILSAVADGIDMNTENCGGHMDTDVMEVGQDDLVSEIVATMNERRPNAVVAIDEDGQFAGYFSPNDYRQAMSLAANNPAIKALEE